MRSPHFLLLCLAVFAGFAARGQVASVQDCIGAIPVCDSIYHEANSYSGWGAISELQTPTGSTSNICFGIGSGSTQRESNSVWYQFDVRTTGVFKFTIMPNQPGTDYDWQIWKLGQFSCADIPLNLNPAVRCDWASPQLVGKTGIGTPPTGQSSGFQPPFTMTAGETYVLLVNNFSNNTTGYTLDLTPSAAKFNFTPKPRPKPTPDTLHCNGMFVDLAITGLIRCSSVAADGSDFTFTDPGGNLLPIASAVGKHCSPTQTSTDTVRITLANPLQNNGVFTLKVKNGTDANTLQAACYQMAVGDSARYVVTDCAPYSRVSAVADRGCLTRTYRLNWQTAGADSVVLDWGDGSPLEQLPPPLQGNLQGTRTHTYPPYTGAMHVYIVRIDAYGYGLHTHDTARARVTLQPRPGLAASLKDSVVCLGNTDSLRVRTLHPTDTLQFTWMLPSGATLSPSRFFNRPAFAQAFIAPQMGLGLYRVEVVAVSTRGCNDTVRAQMRVAPLPQPQCVIRVDGQCGGGQVTLRDLSTGADTLHVLWGDGSPAATIRPTDSIAHQYSGTGTDTATLTAVSAGGCSAAIQRVVAPPHPPGCAHHRFPAR